MNLYQKLDEGLKEKGLNEDQRAEVASMAMKSVMDRLALLAAEKLSKEDFLHFSDLLGKAVSGEDGFDLKGPHEFLKSKVPDVAGLAEKEMSSVVDEYLIAVGVNA